jgi:hypothetical protein
LRRAIRSSAGEPERWAAQGDSLQIVTDKATDFWRELIAANRDSCHFLGFPTAEAFTTEIRLQGDFDQAGVMVRVDAYRARLLIVGDLFTLAIGTP